MRNGRLWCPVSQAWMSTEFANSRFLLPFVIPREGRAGNWALFIDSDFLVVADIVELFSMADPNFAVMVVKHAHRPGEAQKMDGQMQEAYGRKNWSSAMLWNLDHPAHRKLTVDAVNSRPGRDLHRFYWLDDDEIGSLDPSWNFLVGYDQPTMKIRALHYTLGTPDMPGCADCDFAADWLAERALLAPA